MDPRIKFEGHKYLLEKFYEKMNYPDCSLVWKDIEHSINNIHDFYDSQFENKQSQPASSFRPKVFYYLVYYLHPKDQEVQTH